MALDRSTGQPIGPGRNPGAGCPGCQADDRFLSQQSNDSDCTCIVLSGADRLCTGNSHAGLVTGDRRDSGFLHREEHAVVHTLVQDEEEMRYAIHAIDQSGILRS